jgi:uncharacterized protein DUF6547
MTEKEVPSRPIDGYKEIIDELVRETSRGVTEKRVVERRTFLETSDAAVYNPFLGSLSANQREMLAQMLHAERVAAIHDVLAVFTWWVETRDVSFTFRGEVMPVDLSGEGLNGDYIGRLANWEWPKDEK